MVTASCSQMNITYDIEYLSSLGVLVRETYSISFRNSSPIVHSVKLVERRYFNSEPPEISIEDNLRGSEVAADPGSAF